jgi:hypothetical protein
LSKRSHFMGEAIDAPAEGKLPVHEVLTELTSLLVRYGKLLEAVEHLIIGGNRVAVVFCFLHRPMRWPNVYNSEGLLK